MPSGVTCFTSEVFIVLGTCTDFRTALTVLCGVHCGSVGPRAQYIVLHKNLFFNLIIDHEEAKLNIMFLTKINARYGIYKITAMVRLSIYI